MKVIQEVGPQKVSFLLTDNAKNMLKAWGLVKAIFPHIITLGCVAHGLNQGCGTVARYRASAVCGARLTPALRSTQIRMKPRASRHGNVPC